MEEDIKNLSEIIELCEEEINNNDENVSAVLDLTDLKSLRNLINRNKDLEEEIENWKFTAKYVQDNYIAKSKIIFKINKLSMSYGLEDNIAVQYLKELL